MAPGRWDGLIRLHLSPEFCARGGPLSAYPAPPDCLAAAGVMDRPADGSADRRPATHARTPVLRRAAYSRRSRRATPSGSCRTPGLDLVEHPERQGDTVVPDSEAPVRVVHHLDRLACEPARQKRRVQHKHHPVIAQGEIAGELALLAPRQDLVKIVGLA